MGWSPESKIEKYPMRRRQLQADLASGEYTQVQLAAKYGVSQPAISKFKDRHAARILEIAEELNDEYVGILITKKVNRMEAYENLFDEALEAGDFKTASRMLHSVAEEMGHLPNRVTLQAEVSAVTRYIIEGTSEEDYT